jgi:hypothetical protein
LAASGFPVAGIAVTPGFQEIQVGQSFELSAFSFQGSGYKAQGSCLSLSYLDQDPILNNVFSMISKLSVVCNEPYQCMGIQQYIHIYIYSLKSSSGSSKFSFISISPFARPAFLTLFFCPVFFFDFKKSTNSLTCFFKSFGHVDSFI